MIDAGDDILRCYLYKHPHLDSTMQILKDKAHMTQQIERAKNDTRTLDAIHKHLKTLLDEK